ncbi:WAT1-related protein [Raphanus sativus]|uniref:WAT1-related protein n=1 Tax=Raphanus sativus TaxID=3726 RepID=A0A6J0LUL0_RAPSA|nr:WAT1-related protein At4g16620-like [Raphanus sativus]KAJ4865986.1 WAT1-related protein [Raphanus sativus]
MMKKETLKEVGIIGGLVGAQVIYAGNSEILSQVLSLGVDPLLVAIFCTFASFILISPLAFLLEREVWPSSLSFKLKTKLVLVSLVGVSLFQWLFFEGMKHTSASMATAMPNLAPAFIFVIAWATGMEKVKLSCMYSRVKMAGTVLCVMGALIMSLMHSSTATSSSLKALPIVPDDVALDKEKILGCLCLFLSICCLSSSIVLQASILVEFPAPVSMFSVVTLIGGFTTVALQYVVKGSMDMGSASVIGLKNLVGYAVLGGLVSGGGLTFNAWVIKRKGPVVVSLFSPIATVVCVVVSAFSMDDSFNLGSFVGMALMFGGLYFVIWAKGKEDCGEGDEVKVYEEESVLRTEFDLEKPLLR